MLRSCLPCGEIRYNSAAKGVATLMNLKKAIRKIIQRYNAKYLFPAIHGRKKRYTIAGKTDGFGAQYFAKLFGIAWCNYMGYEYVDTPFQAIEFSQNIQELNQFVGIPSEGTDLKPDIVHKVPPIIYLPNPDVFFTKHVLKTIKDYYYSTPKPKVPEYDIAIHIRRGDVSPVGRYSERYTPNEKYLTLIKFFQKEYPGHSICIYSLGEPRDFSDLQLPGVVFNLNGSVTEAFHGMVCAKMLVTAIGTFSYTAALLSEGAIFYLPFFHHPLKHWTVLRESEPLVGCKATDV